MSNSQYPRLADPSDIPRLLSGEHVHQQWPPAGTTVITTGHPEIWPLVVGQPSTGEDGDWWVTDLATVAVQLDSDVVSILASLGRSFTGPITTLVSAAGNWPVIYTQGEATSMRWIATTFRGLLGTTEQFQFGINWGNPGADPDPNEAETLAFAELCKAQFAANWIASTPNGQMNAAFDSSVVFTEVGAVVKTQTDGTASDGSGGNLEQKFDTQWAAWTVGTRPAGIGTGPTLPYEVACAVTLQTDKRGPSGRGRIYLPPFITSSMVAGGLFEAATTLKCAQAIGAFLEDVATASGHVPLVVSRRRIQLNEVTSLNVGRVPDSQRRRRRSQDEARALAWSAA